MKSQHRNDRRMTVTERPGDFGPRRGTVLANGCSCCCCCCLWSAGAALGATTGFVLARRMGKHAYRDLPRCIRRGFWRWGGMAITLVLLAPPMLTLTLSGTRLTEYWLLVVIFLPLLLVPFSVGGLIGAYRARGLLSRACEERSPEARDRRWSGDGENAAATQGAEDLPRDGEQVIGPGEVSMRPVWRVVGFMWLGAIIGTGLGILIFIPIASNW